MPPPPITPSPHRFVLPHDSRGRATSTQRFRPPPRFSFSSSIRHHHQEPTHSSPLVTHEGTQSFQTNPREDIDSSSLPESSLPEHLEPDHHSEDDDDVVLPSTEDHEGQQKHHLPSRPLKRARHYLTTHEADDAANNDDPIPSSSPSAPRFHNLDPPSTAATRQHHPSIKPHTPFVLPPEPPRAHSPPLALLFSPHRTNRHHSSRFLPGGLASEVREWVIHTSSASSVAAAASSSAAQGQGQYVYRVEVQEARSWDVGGGDGGCFVFVSRLGRDEEVKGGGEGEIETHMKMLLVGSGGVGGQQRKRRLEMGDMLGLRQPIWDVILQGERWSVAVDWSIL